MPMSLRVEPTPDDPSIAAVCYGPLVLAGELGTEKFTKDIQFAPDQRARHGVPSIDVPVFMAAGKDVKDWIKPVPGKPMTWRTEGVGKPNEVTLIPLLPALRPAIFGLLAAVYPRGLCDRRGR